MMKLQDQVCTLEQAKKLKELGVSQTGRYSWFGFEDKYWVQTTKPVGDEKLSYSADLERYKIASAFTVAELGVMLPLVCNTYRMTDGKWVVLFSPKEHYARKSKYCDTEAESRADMLLTLLYQSRK